MKSCLKQKRVSFGQGGPPNDNNDATNSISNEPSDEEIHCEGRRRRQPQRLSGVSLMALFWQRPQRCLHPMQRVVGAC